MRKIFTKAWFEAAAIRAIRTFAQTAIAGMGVSLALSEIDWLHVASVSVVAALLSILTSLAGLPEVEYADDIG